MIREPAAAGKFYPASPPQLEDTIRSMLDPAAEKVDAIGLVSPHAGYTYSGPVAGAAISRINLKDTAIIIGPNHTGLGKRFSIMTEGSWRTPLGDVDIDSELAGEILALSDPLEKDSQAHQHEHSIEVQLPFLQYLRPDIKLVPIVQSHVGAKAYKELGESIAQAIKKTNREAVIIASSDMTHYEPQAQAKEKDTQAIEAILGLDEDELMKRVEELDISMCGYAPTVALISAAKALGADKAELVKYQTSGDTTGDYDSVVGYAGIVIRKVPPLVKLAQDAVESYITRGAILTPPQKLIPEMKGKAGTFVSIHKQGGLRGCIGTFEPTRNNIAEEVINNAVCSATRDPRFPTVTPEELPYLEYSVDVLTPPEPVKDREQLDPKRYGVIVERGERRGLLLPDLEGVDDVGEQLDICRQKADIDPDEAVDLYRFEVKRYK